MLEAKSKHGSTVTEVHKFYVSRRLVQPTTYDTQTCHLHITPTLQSHCGSDICLVSH